jgi:hypothetical protein
VTEKCKHADENRKWGIIGPLCALCYQESIERLRADNERLRDAVTLGMRYLKGRYPVPVKEKEVLAQMQAALDSKEQP